MKSLNFELMKQPEKSVLSCQYSENQKIKKIFLINIEI